MITIEQLAKLAELAPDMCQKDEFEYIIGGYIFWLADDGEFSGRIPDVYCHFVGQPALDWLQCALQKAIGAQGMYWGLRYWKPRNKYEAEVANQTEWANTATGALLGALIKVLEVKK